MTFTTPGFWYAKKGLLSLLLWPLSLLYLLIIKTKTLISRPIKPALKVICVGNATVGGAGKTPICLFIAEILQQKNIAFLSRGYKASYEEEALKVDLNKHDAKLVGDEALLLAKVCPTYVAKNKIAGIKLAEQDNIQIIIMDDGLQNETIKKDFSILVIDGMRGFGNGLLLPAGPMREPLSDALHKADLIIVADAMVDFALNTTKEVIYTKTISTHTIKEPKNVVAFAGIGNPEKFFNLARKSGYILTKTKVFPDHYQYTEKDLAQLLAMGDNLLTTTKDLVKIPASYHLRIKALETKIVTNRLTFLADLLYSMI